MLEYKVRHSGEVTILDLSGRISTAEALAFGPGSGLALGNLLRDLAGKGHKKILLGLHDVKYIDSSGMGDMVRSLTGLRREGGDLKLLSPAPTVAEVLKLTHLDRVFDIQSDEAAAIRSFSMPIAAAG